MNPTAVILATLFASFGQQSDPPGNTAPEIDLDIRLGGVSVTEPLGQVVDSIEDKEIIIPDFINKIPIELNGAEWDLWDPGDRRHRAIVHIGDSHMQADMATAVVRDMMQYDYGAAGRGLIEPLRLSGTNEPRNYLFRSNIDWKAEKFMRPSGTVELGFTGCALYADSPYGVVEVGTNDKVGWDPFTSVTLYIDGDVKVTGVSDSDGLPMRFEADYDQEAGITELHLPRAVTLARLTLEGMGRVVLRGALLSADRPGLYYHVIGHNGATCGSYNDIKGFGEGVARLSPDLIIISLGTNDAFGTTFDASAFKARIDRLVTELRTAAPSARLLLVTPQECDRRISSRTRRRGKSVRRSSFTVNKHVARARDAILEYGRANSIPVYDFYAVAGGDGSAARWVAEGLMSKDHVHLSADGYRLQGRLLYDALSLLLNPEFDEGTTD